VAEVLVTWTLPAESKEFIGPITVKVNNVAVGSFDVAFTDGPTARPTTWASADVIGADKGILVGPGTSHTLIVGHKYTVWVRFTDDPEIPVTRACLVKVT
jgi:hypothetical protein